VNDEIKLNTISHNTLAYGKFTNHGTYLNMVKMNNELSNNVRNIMVDGKE